MFGAVKGLKDHVWRVLLGAVLAWFLRPRTYEAIVADLTLLLLAVVLAPKVGRGRWRPSLLGASVCLALLGTVPPLWFRVGAYFNGWRYDWDLLRPKHTVPCDVEATAEWFLQQPHDFKEEPTPHWDPIAQQCDCGRPDHGFEGGACKPPHGGEVHPTFTVVTALIDIGRRNRDPCTYLKYLGHHLYRDMNLVVFAEAWAVPFVEEVRRRLGLRSKTVIREVSQDSPLIFKSLLPQMRENIESNFLWHWLLGFKAGRPANTIANYGWINHQKVDFLRQAVELNPFNSEYFVWNDAGLGHGGIRVPEHFCACNIAVPGTVTLVHQAASEQELFESGFQGIQHRGFLHSWGQRRIPLSNLTLADYKRSHWLWHGFQEIIGTFYGGHKQSIQLLFKDYRRLLLDLTETGYVGDDQLVLTLLAAERPPYLRFLGSSFYGVGMLC